MLREDGHAKRLLYVPRHIARHQWASKTFLDFEHQVDALDSGLVGWPLIADVESRWEGELSRDQLRAVALESRALLTRLPLR